MASYFTCKIRRFRPLTPGGGGGGGGGVALGYLGGAYVRYRN